MVTLEASPKSPWFVFLAGFLSLDFVISLNWDDEKAFWKVNAVRRILLKSKEMLMCVTTHKKSACKAGVLDNAVSEEKALCSAELFVK